MRLRRLFTEPGSPKPGKTIGAGFTIIEVMIVLAIAALILLIVFLAVPALQRNSRNTQYRSEAARILGGANELVANSSGNVPTTNSICSGTGGGSVNCDYAGTIPTPNDAQKIWQNANKPSNISNITALRVVVTATSSNTVTNTTLANLYIGHSCGTVSGAVANLNNSSANPPPPAKSMALVFAIEAAGGTFIAQCQPS